MASGKKKKMEEELKQIRRLQSIKDVIDRSSAENTLLYTSSRENDSMSEDVIDNLLNRMSSDREANQDIRVVESLSKESKGRRITKTRSTSIRKGKKGVKVKRSVHAVKSSSKRASKAKKRTKRSAGKRPISVPRIRSRAKRSASRRRR